MGVERETALPRGVKGYAYRDGRTWVLQPAAHEKLRASKGGFLNLSTIDVLGQKLQTILGSGGCPVHGREFGSVSGLDHHFHPHPAVTTQTVYGPCLISAWGQGPRLRTTVLNQGHKRSDSLSPSRGVPLGPGTCSPQS